MNLSSYCSAFTILAALTLSVPAWADIAPDDACSASALGQACDNAAGGSASLLPGVCKQAMCSRSTPDGPITYACYRCEVAEHSMGGQPNEAGSAGASATGAKAGSSGVAGDTKTSDDGGGCAVSQARGSAGLAAALTALGLLVVGLRRRGSLTS